MRTFLVALLLTVCIISVASAELLTTANPIGQGKWALEGFGLQNQNVDNDPDISLTAFGGYVGYGILDQLDLYVNAAMGNAGGLPAGIEASMTSFGADLKYSIIEEAPVSVAVGAGYSSTNTKVNVMPDTPGTQMKIGVGVSKIMAPFVPYGAVAYRTTTSDGAAASTQIDGTIGTAIAWSEQGAVLLEYTMQSITPDGGSAYTSNQIAGGVAYKL